MASGAEGTTPVLRWSWNSDNAEGAKDGIYNVEWGTIEPNYRTDLDYDGFAYETGPFAKWKDGVTYRTLGDFAAALKQERNAIDLKYRELFSEGPFVVPLKRNGKFFAPLLKPTLTSNPDCPAVDAGNTARPASRRR